MSANKEIKQQRVSVKNIGKLQKMGKPNLGESFDDLLGRVLDECEKRRKTKTEED
jgi:hypothetical protein